MAGIRQFVIVGVWVALFGATIAWPLCALLWEAIREVGQQSERVLSARMSSLLGYTLGLASAGAVVALGLAVPAAWVIGRTRRILDHPIIVGLLTASLFLSPTVCAFGWQRLSGRIDSSGAWPVWVRGELLCVVVWSLWIWPVPALVLGTAWARTARQTVEAARLNTGAFAAFLRVGVPQLIAPALAAFLASLLLLLAEYNVPHLCGLIVVATELLGLASNSVVVVDTLLPALPICGLALFGLVLLVCVSWRAAPALVGEASGSGESPRSNFVFVAIAGMILAAVGVPAAGVAGYLSIPASLVEAVTVYEEAIVWSFVLAVASGLAAVVMATLMGRHPTVRKLGFVLAVIFGILPGALIGKAMLSAYLHVPIVYDHWPILLFTYVGRFAWIAVLFDLLGRRMTAGELTEQARLDGASGGQFLLWIQLPLTLPLMMIAVCAVAAFAISDVAASSLVRVPGVGIVSHIMIDKFHFMENEMLAALGVVLLLVPLGAVLAVAVGVRAMRRAGLQ